MDGQDRLQKTFRCKNFKKALELCARVGDIAEAEGHHPDMHLTVGCIGILWLEGAYALDWKKLDALCL